MRASRGDRASLPPGPRAPGVAQLARWLLRPTSFLEACARRHGDLFTLRLPSYGDERFVVASSPALVREIFTAPPDVLRAGRAQRRLVPILGPSSLLVVDGEEHVRQRRFLVPALRQERMATYAELTRAVAEEALDRWPLRRPFDLEASLRGITLAVILRAVFGLPPGAEHGTFARRLVRFVMPPHPLVAFMPMPEEAVRRARAELDADVFRLVRERRAEASAAERNDILSVLLRARDDDGRGLTDEELRDEILTLLAGGYDTTADALTWAFAEVLGDARAREALTSELRERGDLLDAAYLDATVREALRLRPVFPWAIRSVARPFALGGYTVPAGVSVGACIYLAQRRAEVFPEPARFRPERFLGTKVDPYAWIPFGGGSRRCVGMGLSLLEMKVVLGAVLSRARLRLARSLPIETSRRALLLAPRGGVRVELVERAPRR